MENVQIYAEQDLITRICKSRRKITFVIGSGLPLPTPPDRRGVPSTQEIVEIVCDQLGCGERERPTSYMSAFDKLYSTGGLDEVNEVVRKAVLSARLNANSPEIQRAIADRRLCEEMELDGEWRLSESLQCLGELISSWPERFNQTVLTSNFDPLIEVSLRKWHRAPVTVDCGKDHSIEPIIAPKCVRVVHFHGFWSSGVTLHLEEQLASPRPKLAASFTEILRDTTLVVIGYGGWRDLFTNTLMEVFEKHTVEAQVLWCTRAKEPKELLDHKILSEVVRKQGAAPYVAFYRVADANVFFPNLKSAFYGAQPRELSTIRTPRAVYDITQPGFARPNSLENFFGLDRSSNCGVLVGSAHGMSPDEIAASLQKVELDIRSAGSELALPRRDWQVEVLNRLVAHRTAIVQLVPAGLVVSAALEELLEARRALSRLAPEIASGQLAILFVVRTPPGGDTAAMVKTIRQELGTAVPYFRIFSIPLASGAGAIPWPGADPMQLTYDDQFISQYAASKMERPDETLLTSSMLSAWRYVTSEVEPHDFLRTRDPRAFDFALRLGVDSDDLLCSWLASDEKKKEVWVLAQRVNPASRFLRELIRRPPAERAVAGLISRNEWDSLSQVQRDTVLEIRDGKPMRLPDSGDRKGTES